MKKRGLVISKEYYPLSNGSVKCLGNILDVLNNSHDLDIFSARLDGVEDNNIDKNISRLFSKFDYPVIFRERFLNSSKIKKSKLHYRTLTKPLFLPFFLLARKLGYIHPMGWANNVVKVVNKDYNYVLTMGAPFDNFTAAKKVAEKYDIPLYLLQLDLYAFNPTHNLEDKAQVDKNLKIEMDWYEAATHIFVTNEMYPVIMGSELARFKHKITAIQMPNLLPYKEDSNQSLQNSDDINILYAGMFYEDIRNPTYMLKFFDALFQKNNNIKLHIMGFGCEEIVNDYRQKWPNNIFVYGHQKQEKVNEMMAKAHILLNVSNKTVSQAPSKIIEAIGTGKPIINFYSVDQDICERILENYELSYSIRETSEDVEMNNVNELLEFIVENKNNYTEYPKIEATYFEYTPTYVANKMLEVMER